MVVLVTRSLVVDLDFAVDIEDQILDALLVAFKEGVVGGLVVDVGLRASVTVR